MTICGSPKAASGRVLYEGQDISRLVHPSVASYIASHNLYKSA